MDRRRCLAAIGSAGALAVAGCSALGGSTTLSDPTVRTEGPGRRSIHFTADGEEVGHVGIDATADDGVFVLGTEIWHREDTTVQSLAFHTWAEPVEDAVGTDVAVVSPVEGDSSPPPSLTLRSPERGRGTVVEVEDIDDLRDETISTLEFLVRPGSEAVTALVVDATVDLGGGGVLGGGYTLDGRLRLSLPELTDS